MLIRYILYLGLEIHGLLLSRASPSQLYVKRLTLRQGRNPSQLYIYIYPQPPLVESHFPCSPRTYRSGWTVEGPTEWVPNIMRVCSMGHKVGSCRAAATALAWPNALREYAAMPAVVPHPPCCLRRSSDSSSSWACAPARLECGTRRVGSNPASAAVR